MEPTESPNVNQTPKGPTIEPTESPNVNQTPKEPTMEPTEFTKAHQTIKGPTLKSMGLNKVLEYSKDIENMPEDFQCKNMARLVHVWTKDEEKRKNRDPNASSESSDLFSSESSEDFEEAKKEKKEKDEKDGEDRKDDARPKSSGLFSFEDSEDSEDFRNSKGLRSRKVFLSPLFLKGLLYCEYEEKDHKLYFKSLHGFFDVTCEMEEVDEIFDKINTYFG